MLPFAYHPIQKKSLAVVCKNRKPFHTFLISKHSRFPLTSVKMQNYLYYRPYQVTAIGFKVVRTLNIYKKNTGGLNYIDYSSS